MTSRDPHRRAPRGTHPPSAPAGEAADPAAPPADPVAPVNPGAWDTRSWTLVDGTGAPPAESGPEHLDAWHSEAGEGAEVVWPEAGHPGTPALDAEGVPLAEPPTGPLHAVDAAPPRRRAAATPTHAPSPAPPAPGTRLHTGVFGPPAPGPGAREPAAGPSGREPLAVRPDAGPEPERPARRDGGARQDGGAPERSARSPRGVRVTGPRVAAPAAEAGGQGHHLTVEDEVPGRPGPDGARAAGRRSSPSSVPPADFGPDEARQSPPAPNRGVHAERDADAESRRSVDDSRSRRSPADAGHAGRAGGRTLLGDEPSRASVDRAPRRAGGAAAPGAGPAQSPVAPRGGSADPVRELMHRHRALCERAVDPLEIAAGLEAHGITDRTAARYRHRDVFSLAEELYVRVPRAEDGEAATGSPDDGERARPRRARAAARALSHLLPGALCAATVVGLTYVPLEPPYARPAVGALGGLAVLAAVRLSLRVVPRTRTAALWACWLLGYLLYGDWLLTELLTGEARAGRLVPVLGCLCVPLALAIGVAPAAWSAHLFAVRARRRLLGSRSLGDFASGVRPLLLLTVGLFALALSAVQAAAHLLVQGAVPPHATQAATAALGVLLFVALLLSRHGFPRAASAGLATACLLIAAALGSVLAARLPGAAAVGRPVEQVVAAFGPTVVPAAACGLAALVLLAYALRVLTGASAHQPPAAREAAARSRPTRQGAAGLGPAPGPAPRGAEPDRSGAHLARQAR